MVASFAIGTRGSPLALAQANMVRERLIAALDLDPEEVVLDIIKTTGDIIQDRALAEAGGKGLFTRELDAAMLAGRIAIAVHSAKDLPTFLPDGIVVAGYLEREDVRDALICPRATSLAALPAGAHVGTASLRRGAQVRRARPDTRIGLLRGNVETRLARVREGTFDATLLAYAGLKRLGLADMADAVLDTNEMLPAVGQGAIAITARADDAATREAVLQISHPETAVAVAAERAFLTILDGSCRTPIAGLARIVDGHLELHGLLLADDGSDSVAAFRRGAIGDAVRLGEDAAREIIAHARPALLPGGGA